VIYEIKKLSFSRTWGETFKLYADNFIPLFSISLVSSLPMLFFSAPRIEVSRTGDPQVELLELMMWMILLVTLNSLSLLFMLEYISKKFQGIHQNAGEYLTNLRPMLGSIVKLAIFTTMIVFLGMLAFIIPGIYAALTLSMAGGVMIVERKPVQLALIRSIWLTHNKKMEIFSYFLLLGIISIIVERGLSFLFTTMEPSSVTTKLQQLIGMCTQSLLAPISACLFILVYFNIRIEKENLKPEQKDNDSTQASAE